MEKRKGTQLLNETRTYIIRGSELAEWISGSENFRVAEITYDESALCFQITLTTAKGSGAVLVETPMRAPRVEPVEPVEPSGPGPHITDLEGGGVDDVPSQIPEKIGKRAPGHNRRVLRPST